MNYKVIDKETYYRKGVFRHFTEDCACSTYFDGNEKSKRVQEKCGFHYHHTAYNVPCAIEGVLRTEHITCLSKEEWQSVR